MSFFKRGPKQMSDADRQEKLSAIGLAIAAMRNEAVTERKSSGIEDVWSNCEDAYLGIDDVNRAEFGKATWIKPRSMEGPLTSVRSDPNNVKSTVFVRLTSRYVDAGAAKLSEIALPIDDKAFSFGPTPVPELIDSLEDESPALVNGQQVMRAPKEGEQVPEGATEVPMQVKDVAEQQLERAKKAATKAETQIYDWMVEGNHPCEMRKVIFDAARIGTGVLKGPFPDVSESKSVKKLPNGTIELEIIQSIKPVDRWVDTWNLFPDPSCGENIHHGDYIFERDYLSSARLKKLKGQSGYINSQIDKVLKEGPGKCNVEDQNPNEKQAKGRFEVWYFYGTVKKEDMEIAECVGIDKLPEGKDEVFAIVTMVNDCVIRATINPLISGKFPYQVLPWSRRAGSWTGVGPGEQVQMPQRMVNASTRALLNNAGITAGGQIVIDKASITPADGVWTITPNKIWYKSAESNIDDVRKAFMSVEFPNVGTEMMNIINYAFKLAEEATNIPLISQGQNGPTTPDTFGAAELQNNNANTLLRSIGYALDDNVTEPLVNGYYEWLLLDPEIPDEMKGDVKINARGSISIVEKAIQENTIIQMASLVTNPVFGADPKKWFTEMLKTKRLDPSKINMSEEDLKKMAEQPPPVPPQIEAAQIRAKADAERTAAIIKKDLEIAGIRKDTDIQKITLDTDRDTAYVNAQSQSNEMQHAARMEELSVRRDLAMLQYANTKEVTLDQIKADLSQTAMKLNLQRELAAASAEIGGENNTPQVATPPTEPAGRAPDGEAYQR